MTLRVLCSHEASGVLRSRFRAAGHDAWSCDLRASYDNSPYHVQCSVFDILDQNWDAAIFQPECTVWTVACQWAFNDPDFVRYPGVGYHQRLKPETKTGQARRDERDEQLKHWERLDAESAHIPVRIYENPIGTIWSAWKPYTQIVQPYEFGDDASKATCLRIDGAGPIQIDPAKRFPGRWVEWPKGSGKMKERWSNQTDSGQNKLPPSVNRARSRADNYPGIADAIVSHLSLPRDKRGFRALLQLDLF